MKTNTAPIEENLNNQLDSQLNDLSEQLEEGLQEGRKTIAELQEMLMSKSKEAAEATDTYVRENPWAALGIAAGLGVIAGLLLRRR